MAARDAVVVGAGVIGLTAAVCLAKRGLKVEVLTDRESSDTASAVASAMIGPAIAPSGSAVSDWEQTSIATFTKLAENPNTGVRMRRGLLTGRDPSVPAPPGDHPPCDPDELPDGFAVGYWATLPLVDMRPYLQYLTRCLREAGGVVTCRHVASLEELIDEASLVVHCSGLGARELAGDALVEPVFGQHLVVENPGIEQFFIEAPLTSESTAYWPYPNHVVIGGVSWPGVESDEPDRELAERMLARCVAAEPRLAGARVLEHQVGLRPGRPEPRLDLETIGATRCVHSYGHGGSGVTLSWGAAHAATDLLLDRAQ